MTNQGCLCAEPSGGWLGWLSVCLKGGGLWWFLGKRSLLTLFWCETHETVCVCICVSAWGMRETADIQKVPAKQEKGKPSGKDNAIFLWKCPQSCLDIGITTWDSNRNKNLASHINWLMQHHRFALFRPKCSWCQIWSLGVNVYWLSTSVTLNTTFIRRVSRYNTKHCYVVEISHSNLFDGNSLFTNNEKLYNPF